MYILGISAYYHDSAAVLIKDESIIFAAEEERFTRIKHDNQFPFQAIKSCLQYANIRFEDIEYVTYYEKPLLKFERILEQFISTYPFSLFPFVKGISEWFGDKIKIKHFIRTKFNYKGNIFFIPHHCSHAAAAFYTSPYMRSAIMTIDGVGEYQTTGLWLGKGNQIIPLQTIDFPHSLGLLYSTFTAFLGFKVNEDEYKLMGLSAYGKPILLPLVNKVIHILEDGSFNLNLQYFSFREGFQMWSNKFEHLFGQSRKPHDPITQRHKNIAASIQKKMEEIYLKIANHIYPLTHSKNLSISGGVALNALANGKIYENSPFKKVHVFGAAGDSGAALGSALYVFYHILKNKRTLKQSTTLYLGTEFTNEEIGRVLKANNLRYIKYTDRDLLLAKTAKLLSRNFIVGWFQGRMEYGPRALGNRSILANPKPRNMKNKVNNIKLREQFRPFAGSILRNKVHEYFDVPEKSHSSPFMTFCFRVRQSKQSDLASIVHKDGTCRVQTVNRDNGLYYKLIKKFYQVTGVPVVLNTSFNLRGEPIVETPKQAVEDFIKTKMDHLVIEDYLISRISYKK